MFMCAESPIVLLLTVLEFGADTVMERLKNTDIGRRTKYEPTNLKLLEHGKGRLIGIKFVKTAKTSSYYSYGKIGQKETLGYLFRNKTSLAKLARYFCCLQHGLIGQNVPCL